MQTISASVLWSTTLFSNTLPLACSLHRHMPDNQLSSLLSSLKLAAPDVTEIAALAKSSNYQLACQRHFDVTHPGHLNTPELKVKQRYVIHWCIVCVLFGLSLHQARYKIFAHFFPCCISSVGCSGEPSKLVVPDLRQLPQTEERQAHQLRRHFQW